MVVEAGIPLMHLPMDLVHEELSGLLLEPLYLSTL
jgi:hypothetical protein